MFPRRALEPIVCEPLRRWNAHVHVTKAIVCGNLAHIKAAKQEQTNLRRAFCASPRNRNAQGHGANIFLSGILRRECRPPEWASRSSIGCDLYRPESLHADTLYRQKHHHGKPDATIQRWRTKWRETNGVTHPKNRTPLVKKETTWWETIPKRHPKSWLLPARPGETNERKDKWEKKQKQREKQTYTDRTTTTLQSHRLPSPQLKGKKIEKQCIGANVGITKTQRSPWFLLQFHVRGGVKIFDSNPSRAQKNWIFEVLRTATCRHVRASPVRREKKLMSLRYTFQFFSNRPGRSCLPWSGCWILLNDDISGWHFNHYSSVLRVQRCCISHTLFSMKVECYRLIFPAFQDQRILRAET